MHVQDTTLLRASLTELASSLSTTLYDAQPGGSFRHTPRSINVFPVVNISPAKHLPGPVRTAPQQSSIPQRNSHHHASAFPFLTTVISAFQRIRALWWLCVTDRMMFLPMVVNKQFIWRLITAFLSAVVPQFAIANRACLCPSGYEITARKHELSGYLSK